MVRLPPLDRKLFRELLLMRGQATAIAVVIAAGVALFVLMLSAFDSLELTQRTYYEHYRFADLFASLKRAPRWLERDIAEIPGVAAAETRVVVNVNLDVPGLERPAMGRLISIPERKRATPNTAARRTPASSSPSASTMAVAPAAPARARAFAAAICNAESSLASERSMDGISAGRSARWAHARARSAAIRRLGSSSCRWLSSNCSISGSPLNQL